MKIAFLNIHGGKVERGAEVFVHEIAGRLAKSHQVDIYQLGPAIGKSYNTMRITQVPVVIHQGQKASTNIFVSYIYFQLYSFTVLLFTLLCLPHLWKNKYDWLVPVNGGWQVIICRLVRFFIRCKIMITGHAGIGGIDKFNILIGQPNKFIALIPMAWDWAKTFYPDEKTAFIANGVDIKRYNPNIKPQR